ncbi:hypothetical protein CAEBREN_14919 [Caenorhabditis brenneri]|uniref:RING-type domain-containing protein n=1 Tax=Caenorhabditis brenneri TaxID=135651 RepID=G0MUQ9_CAEBE|nr:hypothetical protein CAEBREN_14919 [Caenorhabditis brenneri]
MDNPRQQRYGKAPRKREQVIPAQQLSWVRQDPTDYWSEPTQLTKEQIVRAHYDNRQRAGEPQRIENVELRKVEEYRTMLKEVDVEEPELLPRVNPEFAYRNHVLPYGAVILAEDYTPNSPELVSEKQFQEIQEKLKQFVAGFGSSEWMQRAVYYQLGPQHIRKVRSCDFVTRSRELGDHDLFINNNQSVACLVVRPVNDSREATIRNIERFLKGEGREKPDEVLISEPSSGFGISLQQGEDPVIVRDARESRYALVFDSNYQKYVGIHEAEYVKLSRKDKKCHVAQMQSSQQFYENLFDTKILSSRLLSDPEKKFIECQRNQYDIRPRPLRLLQFEDSEKRRKAVTHKDIQHLDTFFCDSQFGYRNFEESIHLYVKYDMRPKNIECVAVKLECELDKRLAEAAFRLHHLTTFFFDTDYKTKNHELKYQQECKMLVVQDFPRYMFKHEVREWFIRRICEYNHIQIESVEPFTERVDGAWKSHIKAKKREIIPIIEFEFYRVGQIHGIYRPIDEPWVEDMQGAMGARCFFNLVKTERPDRPWKVTNNTLIKKKNEENFTVHFKSVQIGLELIEKILEESHNRAVFQVDRADRQGPEIRPCYRKTFAISRRLRIVLHCTIRRFDNEIRRVFSALTTNEDPIMMVDESIYYRLRVHEEWRPGSDAGIIGVMGWTVKSVRLYAQKLEALLQPKTFKNCPHLLHGIGELYAKHLEDKYPDGLVVEVDRFNEEVKFIGDSADLAMKDLESFLENRAKIGIAVEIPLHFPYINSRVTNLLYKEKVEKLRKAIGINYLFYDRKEKFFEFEGSIEQYEKLMRMMHELSLDYYKKETAGRALEDLPQQTCPTCWTEIGMNNDFYRFQCGHVMCRLCTNAKIRNIESSDIKIKCDFAGCGKFVAPSEILNIILGGPDRIRDFDTAKLHPLIIQCKQAIFFSNPDVIGCTSINCPGLLSKSDGDLLHYKTCASCSREYCRQCLAEPHKDVTCEEYSQVRHVDYSMKAYMKASGPSRVKKCPKCSTVVEKEEGCNHIECKCGLHFCWLCMHSSEDGSGPIYAHMTEVHGGHGGYQVNPEDLPDADIGVQHALHDAFRPEQFSDTENELSESDDDDSTTDDEARRFHNRLPRRRDVGNRLERERARQDHFNNMRWPNAQMAPPPPPPPRPQAPPHLWDFPPVLQEILQHVQISDEDRELYLAYLNNAATMADRENAIGDVAVFLTARRNGEVPLEQNQMNGGGG